MRPTRFSQLAALVVGVAFFGCASTSTSSYRDPSFANVSYRRVAVMASGVPLGDRQEIERRLASALRGKRIQAVEAMQLLPPTRQFTQEETMAALRERGFDALLFVERVESGSKAHVIILTTDTEQREYVTFEASLIDVSTSQTAWVGSLRTEANSSYASNSDLLESLTSSTADELAEKGLLAAAPAR